MADRTQRPIAIDLYAGVGGLSLGIMQAGFDVVASVEADEVTARYYRFNHPGTTMLIEEVSPLVLGRLTGRVGKDLALVVGGPPCQGFSLAGRHRIDDCRNKEVGRFAEMIVALRPLAFIMENVRGILCYGAAQLRSVRSTLAEVYAVGEPQVLNAADFGVPQARERVFLIGIRRDVGVIPMPIHPTIANAPTVADAITDVPVAPPGMESATLGIRFESPPESGFAKEMRGLVRSLDDRHGPPIWDSRYCTNAVPTRHGNAVRTRFERLGPGETDPISRLRRLDPDGVSVTIRAGTTDEYGSRSAPRPIHPFEDRVLTTRECARLQSFPDWYLFHPTRWHGNRQVGNAVPPLLARAVGNHVLRALDLEVESMSMPSSQRDHSLVARDFRGAPWLRNDDTSLSSPN